MWLVPVEITSSGTGATDSCEKPRGCWNSNLHPLEKRLPFQPPGMSSLLPLDYALCDIYSRPVSVDGLKTTSSATMLSWIRPPLWPFLLLPWWLRQTVTISSTGKDMFIWVERSMPDQFQNDLGCLGNKTLLRSSPDPSVLTRFRSERRQRVIPSRRQHLSHQSVDTHCLSYRQLTVLPTTHTVLPTMYTVLPTVHTVSLTDIWFMGALLVCAAEPQKKWRGWRTDFLGDSNWVL